MPSQSDNAVTFSFDTPSHKGVDEAALRAAISVEAGEPAEPAPAPAAAKASADPPPPPAAATPPETSATPPASPAPPADELKTYKIVVEGQELEVTEADLKAGHMRQRDYTQKTQRLSDREKQLTAQQQQWTQEQEQVRAELARIDQFLKDQAAIDAYYEQAFGKPRGQIQAPQVDPNKPLTADDVARIAAYNAEQIRMSSSREIAAVRAEALKAQQIATAHATSLAAQRMEADVDKHLSGLLDKYPILRKFDAIEEELFADASRFKPTSLDDAKVKLTEAVERKVAVIKAITADEAKSAAVKAAALKKTGTEPLGGTPPPRPAGKTLSMDDRHRKERLAAAEADVRAFLDAQG